MCSIPAWQYFCSEYFCPISHWLPAARACCKHQPTSSASRCTAGLSELLAYFPAGPLPRQYNTHSQHVTHAPPCFMSSTIVILITVHQSLHGPGLSAHQRQHTSQRHVDPGNLSSHGRTECLLVRLSFLHNSCNMSAMGFHQQDPSVLCYWHPRSVGQERFGRQRSALAQ